jgi:hypothetical protein
MSTRRYLAQAERKVEDCIERAYRNGEGGEIRWVFLAGIDLELAANCVKAARQDLRSKRFTREAA